MSSPDVRVRLTPEGVREVVQALRNVQREGQRANRQSAQGLSVVGQAAKQLRGLLPKIGLAGAVASTVALGRQALQSADEMGKLAAVTGTTAENLSVFRHEAELGGARLEEQRVGLVTLSQNLERLRQQAPATVRAFSQIGLSVDDFAGKDSVEAIELVARAVASIEDPARKTAAAKALLGESGARLIPTLESLARKGLAGARAEAEALGVVIGDDLAANAAAARDSMALVQKQVQGVALSFIGELAPYITQAMTTLREETTGAGLNAMRTFGRGVGIVLGAVINLFRLLAGVATGVAQTVGLAIGSVAAAIDQAVRGNFRNAAVILKEGGEDMRRTLHETFIGIFEDTEKLVRDLTTDPPDAEVPVRVNVEVEGGDTFDAALAKARLDARRQAVEQEVALQKAALEQLNDANEQAFERGLVSLEEYTRQRQAIIERQAALELNALRLQRDALAQALDADPGQTAAQREQAIAAIGALDAQIRTRQLQLARELAQVEADRQDTARELGDEWAEQLGRIAELEGRRHEAFESNLAAEIRQVRELGRRAGQTSAEIEATVQRLAASRRGQFNFEEVTRQGEQALQAFNRDAELIRRDAEAGVISQLEGERRLIELQRERLGVLRELAAATLEAADATGNPELIARAQQFADSVDQIGLSFQNAIAPARALKSAAVDALQSGISNLLQNLTEIESVEDAFRSLARTVAQTMAQIAAEILARQAVLALLRAFGGGAGGAAAAVAQTGGRVRGYAGGGDIVGPQLPIPGPDRVPILAQKGEFMMRRARVLEPGALDFLRRWNRGDFTLRQIMRRPRFQAGGIIGGSAAPIADARDRANERGRGVRIVNVLDDGLVHDAMNTAAGEEVILNVIERNGEKIRRLTGG